ncbi:hypothetical protein [Halomonas sp. M20]|uniref:hypothetical protein n=1 Tax=Halomonas sp. M20 TaxID=2763264 RepID=UPI001D0B84B0|nr:hypothetical protein [Halomonas sp. M20]
MYFDLGKYHSELLFLYCRYKELRAFCLDTDALYAHVTENKYVEGFQNGEYFKSTDKLELEKWLTPKTDTIITAFDTFELQMPVIFASYLEDAIVTFLTAYFVKYENCMGDYVNPPDQDNIKGFVKIGDILKYNTIEELKESLASRAAHNAASGKSKKKVFARIEALTKHTIQTKIKDKTIALYDKRNEIIHENKKFDLGMDYIEEIYDDCIASITELGKICVEKKVPFNDPSGLLR